MKQNGYNVGTNYGRQGGLKHQHPQTRQKLSSYIEWEHKSGVWVMSEPHESVSDLVTFLNSVVPGSIKRSNHFSELLRGESKSRFGWTILKVLTIDENVEID